MGHCQPPSHDTEERIERRLLRCYWRIGPISKLQAHCIVDELTLSNFVAKLKFGRAAMLMQGLVHTPNAEG